MKKSILKGSVTLLLLCGVVLSSGCVGYVYDGGVGLGGGWGWRGGPGWGWRGGHGGGWRGRPGHGFGRGGGWHRGGGGFRGGRRHLDAGMSSGDIAASSLSSAQVEKSAVETLAADFEIRQESAQKVLQFASGKNVLVSMKSLGLGLGDYKYLKNHEMPSDEVVERVSAALDEDSVKIKALLSSFLEDTKVEAAQDQDL